MKVNLFDRESMEQYPWFQPDSKLLPSQRISLANLQDFIYGNSDKAADDDDSDAAYPTGCNAASHFREVLSSSYKAHKTQRPTTTKDPMSVFHMLTACTSTNVDELKEIVGRAYHDALNSRCGPEFDDYDMPIPASMDTFEDEEDNRLRRLGSWNTLGTMGTTGTLGTSATQEYSTMHQFDDDGHPINPKILQAAHENKKHYPAKRTRLVKFDYPPVTSMRQCPRADRDDLPELFFTEEELENYEADRECTRRTDDIEIVAISKSLSDLNQPEPTEVEEIADPSPRSPATSPRAGFGSYVPTPRILNGRRAKPSDAFPFVDDHPATWTEKAERRNSLGKASRPTPESPAVSQSHPSQPSPRLVKSVQIFLRERSTGK